MIVPTFDARPQHRPHAPDAPIPGIHHYSGCDPDMPRVTSKGVCEGCGERACPECGLGGVCDCCTKCKGTGFRTASSTDYRACTRCGGSQKDPDGWHPV